MNSKSITAQLTALTLLLTSASWAAGTVEYLEGEVGLISLSGATHRLHVGNRVEAGDTLITGKGGELNIVTDDSGYISLRPDTKLMVVAYRAKAGNDDAIVLRLLQGSFRSITGWVTEKNPSKYSVNTRFANIGARGALDHEPSVISLYGDSKIQPGTYDYVLDGESTLSNELGEVKLVSGKMGFASNNTTPAQMANINHHVFVSTANQARIDAAKKRLITDRENSYLKAINSNDIKTTSIADKSPVIDLKSCEKVSDAFKELLSAYDNGNVYLLQRSLSPSFIGHQSFIDKINKYNNQHKQIRTHLSNVRLTCGPDVGVIDFYWEKRSLLMPSFSPRLETGFSSVLLHRANTGWEMAAVSGDNPFYSNNAGSLATVSVSVASIPCNTIGTAGSNPASNFTVTIVDPDMAGATKITANALAGSDITSITLSPSTPGSSNFVSANVPVFNGSISTSPSAVDIFPSGGSPPFTCTPNTITVRYKSVNSLISLP